MTAVANVGYLDLARIGCHGGVIGRERGREVPQVPPPQRSVSKAPGRGPFRGRRPGALRDQQVEEVANVSDPGRALTGGQLDRCLDA